MPKKNSAKPKSASTAKNDSRPNKSEFIRAHSSLPAADIVAKGKEAGLSFGVEYVYSVRQNAKKMKGAKPSSKSPKAAGASAVRAVGGGGTGAESTFRRLVVELGVGRARTLVGEVESKLSAIVRGL